MATTPSKVLVLASSSPRRRDLLQQAGIPFTIQTSTIDEIMDPAIPARELCLINADRKATEVALRFPDQVVLGADTVVALDNEVMGKPRDLDDARRMLEKLCGRTHEVLTGVCLRHEHDRKVCHFVEATRVKFKPLDSVDLDAYLRDIHVLDKAGAYAAQEDEGRIIECIEGLLSNVIGLPVERVVAALEEHFSDR